VIETPCPEEDAQKWKRTHRNEWLVRSPDCHSGWPASIGRGHRGSSPVSTTRRLNVPPYRAVHSPRREKPRNQQVIACSESSKTALMQSSCTIERPSRWVALSLALSGQPQEGSNAHASVRTRTQASINNRDQTPDQKADGTRCNQESEAEAGVESPDIVQMSVGPQSQTRHLSSLEGSS
jgi:hypothetical protein